jgi:uncharacterized membrane protein
VTARWPEMSRSVDETAHLSSGGPTGRLVRTRSAAHPDSLAFLAGLLFLAVLVPADSLWVAQLLLVLLLLTLPGVLLLRALRIPRHFVVSFPVYVPCASLVVLLSSGLAADLGGPLVGVAKPLRPWPLLVTLELICLGLVAVSANVPANVAISWRSLRRPGRAAVPLFLPLVAAAGALRLNSGYGNSVALIALSASVLIIVAVLVYAPRLDAPMVAIALYAIGLAMLWSFSLRGASVYGFDISDEYYIFQQTVLAGLWHPAHAGNAYAALLSNTVLPAEFHALSGLPDLLVFKVLYPALTALIPVGVFYLARRILSARWAFAAGTLLIAQSSFGQELPAIARQEIALVLFTALVAAILESGMSRRQQWGLIISFALSMVASHYTTSYVTITLLGLGIAIQYVASWFRLAPRICGGMLVAFLTATLAAFLWYGPVTHSAANVTQFARAAQTQGLNFLPNRTQGEGLIASYLDGNIPTPMSAAQYAAAVRVEYAATKPYVHPLSDASDPQYALRDSVTPNPPVRWKFVYDTLSKAEIVAQQVIYLLATVGAIFLLFRRKISPFGRQIGLLTLGTLLFLVTIRLSGTLATFYNSERALLQAMVFLDIPLFWCLQALNRRPKLGRGDDSQHCHPYQSARRVQHESILARAISWAAFVAGAGLIVAVFIPSNGLAGAVFGSGTATNLANSGSDYSAFFKTDTDLASASWLGAHVREGQLVYADQYGQLPLVSVTGIVSGLMLDITPGTLSSQAWVYANRTNVILGQAHSSFGDHTISYVFPARFLNANYNLVYTNGSSEVYHR